jgi:NAD(P)-dependent dehydrogenase (short-subunit alcohol dehydrogenase family)
MLAECGATVVLNGRKSDERLHERAEQLSAVSKLPVRAIGADARSPGEVTELYRNVHSMHRRLDVLVANAGRPSTARNPARASPWRGFEITGRSLSGTPFVG